MAYPRTTTAETKRLAVARARNEMLVRTTKAVTTTIQWSLDDRSDRVRDHRPHLTDETQAVEHAVGAMWEEDFRRLYRHFESERDAYAHLLPLQGTAIPRLFLVGTWLPPDERAYQLPALVMEYIPDAVTLGDLAGDVLDPQMCAALVRTIESFPKYGVYHGDLNEFNVLFTPRERPQRAVVIGFGCSVTRKESDSEESWDHNALVYADGARLRDALERKGVVLARDVQATT